MRAAVEEAAPTVTEVGGSAVEDKAGKTRAELAANTPIGPRAGKAAAAAGAAAAATSAIGSSAAAAPIVGAQHAAPAANVSAVTRPRTEETATEFGAAAAAALAMPGNGAASGGQVELTKPADWDYMSMTARKKNWKRSRAKHKGKTYP